MVKKITSFAFGLFIFSLSQTASAKTMQLPPVEDLTRFQKIADIHIQNIITPKTVIVESDESFGSFIIVQDENTQDFIPHRVDQQNAPSLSHISASQSSITISGNAKDVSDKNNKTSLTFDPQNLEHFVVFQNPKSEKIKGFNTVLSENTLAPKTVSIQALMPNGKWIDIIRNEYFSSYIKFPEIAPTKLKIIYKSPNILRINEIQILSDLNSNQISQIIFFAEEGHSYKILLQPAFGQKPKIINKHQPLNTDTKTPKFQLSLLEDHIAFNNDYDGDNIPDNLDLCPRIADSGNLDIDKNGRGDKCEDPDQDGIFSEHDNCPFVYNPSQTDKDADLAGDACDKVENRVSEKNDLWMTLSFIVMILALGFLVGRSVLKPIENKIKNDEE